MALITTQFQREFAAIERVRSTLHSLKYEDHPRTTVISGVARCEAAIVKIQSAFAGNACVLRELRQLQRDCRTLATPQGKQEGRLMVMAKGPLLLTCSFLPPSDQMAVLRTCKAALALKPELDQFLRKELSRIYRPLFTCELNTPIAPFQALMDQWAQGAGLDNWTTAQSMLRGILLSVLLALTEQEIQKLATESSSHPHMQKAITHTKYINANKSSETQRELYGLGETFCWYEGSPHEAIAVHHVMSDGEYRDRLGISIPEWLCKWKCYEQALDFVSSIDNEEVMSEALKNCVTELAGRNEMQYAFIFADSIPQEQENASWALYYIVRFLNEDRLPTALELLPSIVDPTAKALAWREVIKKYLVLDQFVKAVETAQSFDYDEQTACLCIICEWLIPREYLDEATDIAHSIPNPFTKEMILKQIEEARS